jgi:sugar-specific transcriptional regulator TrmB
MLNFHPTYFCLIRSTQSLKIFNDQPLVDVGDWEKHSIMDHSTLVQKLKAFGLMENEAKVYLALVLKGPLRPSEISEVSGVARAEVHRHLRSLEGKGFSLVVAGKSKQYSATLPGEALSSFVEQEEIRRDLMIKKKDELVSRWAGSEHPADSTDDESERFQVLKDAQAGMERGTRLIMSARKVARVLLHSETLRNYFSSGILQSFDFSEILENQKGKLQAEVRILLVSKSDETENLKDILSKVESALNLKLKWMTSPLLEVLPDAIIVDENTLLIRATPARMKNSVLREREAKAIVTNISSMVSPFLVLFDDSWNNADDYSLERNSHHTTLKHSVKGEVNGDFPEIYDGSSMD